MIEVSISPYREYLGNSIVKHNYLKSVIKKTIIENLTYLDNEKNYKINVYNMCHNKKDIIENTDDRLIILLDCATTFIDENLTYGESLNINGVYINSEELFPPYGNGKIIYAEDNTTPIAEYFQKENTLYILFNAFTDKMIEIDIFTYIIKKFNDEVLYEKYIASSWKNSKNKDELAKTILENIKKQKESVIQNDLSLINSWKNNLSDYKVHIRNIVENIERTQRKIATEQKSINDVAENLIKDLDLIINHPKIEDLHIKNGKFIIYTVPLIIHSDIGKKYYGGRYRIELDPNNVEIKFFGDNPRHGYWTTKDPHPHVSGHSGTACLGNMESTVAELSAQMQIYALTLICIDFLESANTRDIAGETVVRWDEIDDDGNIICEGYIDEPEQEEHLYYCENCDEGCDELFTVYDRYDEEEGLIGEHRVCQLCREEYYYYDPEFDAYILDE